MKKTGVLLLNLGTPNAPVWSAVGKYLLEFLNDPRVIDIPSFFRFLLVNVIIVPFRTRKSTMAYKKLWAHYGRKSPLMYYTQKQAELLQQKLGQHFEVFFAMRYQNPSIADVLEKMKLAAFEKIIVLPLFPQYASASGGSAIAAVLRKIQSFWVIPHLEVLSDFYLHPLYIEAMAQKARFFDLKTYDRILFSYHGVPMRHLTKARTDGQKCVDCGCEKKWDQQTRYCYRSQCYATTAALIQKLDLEEQKCEVVFQSRLGKEPWTMPFAEDRILDLAKQGIKKVLVFSPAFVTDCLETQIEIAEEYAELFQKNGGGSLELVSSLNDSPIFVEALADLVQNKFKE